MHPRPPAERIGGPRGRLAPPRGSHLYKRCKGGKGAADAREDLERLGQWGRWRCRNSAAIALSDGGDTAMRVLGQEALAFSRARPGSGAAFLSELWRRTERASEGVWKLAIFYGYMLGTRRPRAEPSRAP